MIVSVFGARPQFVKAAVLSKAFSENSIPEKIVHTGQHYDQNMSDVFFSELGLPGVDLNLAIGSGHHGYQTGNMMIGIEKYISQLDHVTAVNVYGDTNSTLAAALVASKMHIPVIHVEAGLRSYNKKMPEEINRIMTDHVSDLLFCSSQVGIENLKTEGIDGNAYDVGDIMYDAVETYLPIARSKGLEATQITGYSNYNLITIHRPANTDNANNMKGLFKALSQVDEVFVWPVHPRNKSQLEQYEIPSNIILKTPFSYLEMLTVLANASAVVTDSGGLQKESYWLKIPCLTVRPQTEWIETLSSNWNQLTEPVVEEFLGKFATKPDPLTWKQIYGTGNTGSQIAKIVKEQLF